GLTPELFFCCSHCSKFVQYDAAEFPARIGEIVRYIGRLDPKPLTDFLVGERLAAFLYVVQFKELEVKRLVLFVTFAFYPVQRQSEESARKFAGEQSFGIAGRCNLEGSNFALCGFEVERNKCLIAAPLDALRRLVLVHHKAVHANTKVGSQPGARGIK